MESNNNQLRAKQKPEMPWKRRKYKHFTAEEKSQLYLHVSQNPDLTLRKIIQWFEEEFHKVISKST
ncbi:hypothetical protein RUND412_009741, partial [Rhizina undulata]